MNTSEIIKWSKEKIKGKFFKLFLTVLISTLFTSIQYKYTKYINGEMYVSFSVGFGFLFYFINVGLTKYFINFIMNKEYKLSDIFSEYKRFFELLVAGIIKDIFLLLYTLLLIIPGIMKAYGYSLYNFLLLDDRYKDLSKKELLKLSDKMMYGHKMELFNLTWFYFIGWHILGLLTLGLLEVWIIPLQKVAVNKFLLEIKNEYELVY